jgi:hypothetical protein
VRTLQSNSSYSKESHASSKQRLRITEIVEESPYLLTMTRMVVAHYLRCDSEQAARLTSLGSLQGSAENGTYRPILLKARELWLICSAAGAPSAYHCANGDLPGPIDVHRSPRPELQSKLKKEGIRAGDVHDESSWECTDVALYYL